MIERIVHDRTLLINGNCVVVQNATPMVSIYSFAMLTSLSSGDQKDKLIDIKIVIIVWFPSKADFKSIGWLHFEPETTIKIVLLRAC